MARQWGTRHLDFFARGCDREAVEQIDEAFQLDVRRSCRSGAESRLDRRAPPSIISPMRVSPGCARM